MGWFLVNKMWHKPEIRERFYGLLINFWKQEIVNSNKEFLVCPEGLVSSFGIIPFASLLAHEMKYLMVIWKEYGDILTASSPVCKVIGEFEVEELISDSLEKLWRNTKKHAGITEDYFYSYFSDKEKGHAIKIGSTRKCRKPLLLKETFGVIPPQSYLYLL